MGVDLALVRGVLPHAGDDDNLLCIAAAVWTFVGALAVMPVKKAK